MATQFYYELDVPVVDYNGVTPNEEGELGWNNTTKKVQAFDGSALKALAYEDDITQPLASANQTLTGVRVITASASNTLSIAGLSNESDSGNFIGLDDSAILRVRQADSARTLVKAGAPVDGTDTAWYVGQLLLDTTSNTIYRASAKSTDPDAAATGSTWTAVTSAATNLAVADQVLTGNREITTGANSLAITGLTADTDASVALMSVDLTTSTLRRSNVESTQVLTKAGVPVNGTDTAWYVGQLLMDTTNNTFYRATVKSTDPDASAAGSIWFQIPLGDTNIGTNNLTLSGNRVLTAGSNSFTISGSAPITFIGSSYTLSAPGVTRDSDDAFHDLITMHTTAGQLERRPPASVQVLTKAGAPVNGTDTAYYAGQLLLDTTNNAFYRATTKSLDPDAAGTGSVWQLVTLGASVPFQQTFVTGDWSAPSGGFRTYTITQATHGKSASGPIHVVTQSDDGTNWVDVDPNSVTVNKTTGDVVIQIVDGTEFDGRAIVSAS